MNKLVPKAETETAFQKMKSERDKRIVERYEAQGVNPNIPEISEEEGISPQTVRNILKNHGIKPVSTAKRGRKFSKDMPASSFIHARIAQVLRGIAADFELLHSINPSVPVLARHIGITTHAYIEISAGRHDIKLSELVAIAAAVTSPGPMTLPQLLTVAQP